MAAFYQLSRRVIVFSLICANIAVAAAPDIIRVACIGNSITAGAKLEKNKCYCVKLGNLLGNDYETGNYGKGGACILSKGDKSYAGSEEFRQMFLFNPHIVTIMLGTNDSRSENWRYKDEFVDDYQALLDSISALSADPAIFICLPPPAFSQKHDISETILANEIVPTIKQIAGNNGLPLIDTRSPFIGREDLYSSDGIHFTDEGTTLMAEIIYTALSADTRIRTSERREFAFGSDGVVKKKIMTAQNSSPVFKASGIYNLQGRKMPPCLPHNAVVIIK